jgi:hypothetical protein
MASQYDAIREKEKKKKKASDTRPVSESMSE